MNIMDGLYSHLAVIHGVSANARTWHNEVLETSTSLITAWASETKTPYDFYTFLISSPTTSLKSLSFVAPHLRTTPVIE